MNQELRHKIGQKFVIGFPGKEISQELRDAVEQYHFGNIILFRENLQDEEQTKRLCQDLHELILGVTGKAPLISIDQEGGMVTRLTEDALNIPGAMALAATEDLNLIRRLNVINGKLLRDQGFSLNLAPVMDINNEVDNPVIGVRSYGDTPEVVATYAKEAFLGLQEGGILASAKHFPGHGDTKVDSHLGLPSVNIDRKTLEERELVPFKMASQEGIATIMTTHILFPQIETEDVPATMSRTILTDILRDEIGFEGLIISDCMEMQAIGVHYGTPYGVKTAFQAGVDLCFVSHHPEVAIESFHAAYEAYEKGEIPMEELDASVARIASYKQRAFEVEVNLKDEEKEGFRKEILDTMSKTFCVVGEKAVSDFVLDKDSIVFSPEPYRATNISNVMQDKVSMALNIGKAFGISHTETPARPTTEDIKAIVDQAKDKKSIILGLYNAHVFTEQLDLWKGLRALGKPILLVALRNPYDLMYLDQAEEVGLSIFEYTEKSMQALIQVLQGEVEASGKLSVQLPERTL